MSEKVMEKLAMPWPMPGTGTTLPQLNASLRFMQPPPLLLLFRSLGEVRVKRRADEQSASRQEFLFVRVGPEYCEKTSVER